MTCHQRNNEFCFPRRKHWGSRGSNTPCFLWGQSFIISVLLYLPITMLAHTQIFGFKWSCTVPLKSKLPPLVSFLVIRVSFLSRRFSFLASCVSFLSRITEAFSMGYITRKKPVTCNNCCAVHCQIDGTFQHKICIDRLLVSYRTRVKSNIERNYK